MSKTTCISLTQGFVAIIDEGDFDRDLTCGFRDGSLWAGRICDHRWNVAKRKYTNYAACVVRIGKKYTTLLLHRAILCSDSSMLVDHRDGNGLNNSKDNIRLASDVENQRNKAGKAGCSSRFKGVSWNKYRQKWRASIKYGGRHIDVGFFENEIDAAAAYELSASELFGEFALGNSRRKLGVPCS